MSEVPFSLSSEAASWVENKFHNARRDPRLLGLRPILSYGVNLVVYEKNGNILGGYDGGMIGISWDEPEIVSGPEFVELDLLGFKVLTHISTFDKLRGRHLEFKAVQFKSLPVFEFLVIKHERDILKQAIRMKTLPKLGGI